MGIGDKIRLGRTEKAGKVINIFFTIKQQFGIDFSGIFRFIPSDFKGGNMLIKKLTKNNEFGIYTTEFIPQGTLLFTHDEWIEDEKEGWQILSLNEINELSQEQKDLFLRYSYDIDFGLSIGTFDWKYARHISNFMNHSCDPNMHYDENDTIIARRDIKTDEELTIDYGTFVVNFDQDFKCNCGSENCRGIIGKDDWIRLRDNYGEHFAGFICNHLPQACGCEDSPVSRNDRLKEKVPFNTRVMEAKTMHAG